MSGAFGSRRSQKLLPQAGGAGPRMYDTPKGDYAAVVGTTTEQGGYVWQQTGSLDSLIALGDNRWSNPNVSSTDAAEISGYNIGQGMHIYFPSVNSLAGDFASVLRVHIYDSSRTIFAILAMNCVGEYNITRYNGAANEIAWVEPADLLAFEEMSIYVTPTHMRMAMPSLPLDSGYIPLGTTRPDGLTTVAVILARGAAGWAQIRDEMTIQPFTP